MKTFKIVGLLIVVTMSITGCSNPTASTEYKSLKSDVDGIQVEVDSLQSKVDSVDILEKKLADLTIERDALENDFATLVSFPSRRSAAISQFGLPACKTFTNAQMDLKAKYDDWSEGSALEELEQLLGARDYAWAGLQDSYDDDPAAIKQYKTELNYDKCFDTHWSNWLDEKCESFDQLLLKKDTNSYIGKCLKGSVKISQADAATGPCGFQGYVSGDYDVRAQFGLTLDTATHATYTDCSESAKKLTEGRTVNFWGYVIGSYTYETTSNGSMTIPAFKVLATQNR